LHIETDLGPLLGDLLVVLVLFRGSNRNVDAWSRVVGPVLGIPRSNLDTGSVDSSRQTFPEMVADEAGKAVDRVFVQSPFIEDDLSSAVLLGQGKLLEQVGKHISAPHVEAVVSSRGSGAQGDDLGAVVFNGNLHVSVGIFLGFQAFERRLDLDQETAVLLHGSFIVAAPSERLSQANPLKLLQQAVLRVGAGARTIAIVVALV
jgi:hypothetical protein